MNAIYLLESLVGDPEFDGLSTPRGHFLDTVPRLRTARHWTIQRVASEWKPPKLKGNVQETNDFPSVDLIHPAFSTKAVRCLGEFLQPNGELLPIATSAGEYLAYNATTVADVLDIDKSEIFWMPDKVTARVIRRYEFVVDRIADFSIFRIPQTPFSIYVTDLFVKRATDGQLCGFDFQKIWPLPPSVFWTELVKESRRRRRSAKKTTRQH